MQKNQDIESINYKNNLTSSMQLTLPYYRE